MSDGNVQSGGPEWRDMPPVKLVSWEVVRYQRLKANGSRVEQTMLRVAGEGGTARGRCYGYYPGDCEEEQLRAALPLVEGHDLLDHGGMYERFIRNAIASGVARAWDLACWDLHARMLEVPLWQFWERTRDRAVPYGDVRYGWFNDVQAFADCVGHRVHEEGMHAVKLHVPGTWGKTWDGSMPPGLDTTLACLRAAREAAGDEAVLAYDPFNPQCFSLEEDLQVVDILQDCG